MKSERDAIPMLIREIYPNLSYFEYKTLKKQQLFLQKKIRVCQNCYLIYQNMMISPKKPQKFKFTNELFFSNRKRIAKNVEKLMSIERTKFNEKYEELKNTSRLKQKIITLANNENKEENFKNDRPKFRLNLNNLVSSKNEEAFNSERTTKFSSRSKELTERYGSPQNISEYFREENSKLLRGMNVYEEKPLNKTFFKSINNKRFI